MKTFDLFFAFLEIFFFITMPSYAIVQKFSLYYLSLETKMWFILQVGFLEEPLTTLIHEYIVFM